MLRLQETCEQKQRVVYPQLHLTCSFTRLPSSRCQKLISYDVKNVICRSLKPAPCTDMTGLKKNHSCEDCGKQFSHTDNLERHRTFIGESRREYCVTKFKDFSSWNRHMEANLDEQGNGKNVWDEYDSVCSSPKRLKLHKKKEHLECKDCNVKFTRKSSLVAHMARKKSACDLSV